MRNKLFALTVLVLLPGCVAVQNDSTAGQQDSRYSSKAYEDAARKSGFFFVRPLVSPQPNGANPVFSVRDVVAHRAPLLSAEMRQALARVSNAITPVYRRHLRFVFPMIAPNRQFFAVFLQGDRLRHVLNLCVSQAVDHCKHHCGATVDGPNYAYANILPGSPSCTDGAPYWRQT